MSLRCFFFISCGNLQISLVPAEYNTFLSHLNSISTSFFGLSKVLVMKMRAMGLWYTLIDGTFLPITVKLSTRRFTTWLFCTSTCYSNSKVLNMLRSLCYICAEALAPFELGFSLATCRSHPLSLHKFSTSTAGNVLCSIT